MCDNSIYDQTQDSIQCYACKGWEHRECFRLKDKYDELTSDHNLHYVCTPCLTGDNVAPMNMDMKLNALMGLLPMVSTLSRRLETVEQNVTGAKLEETISNIVDKKLDKKVAEALDEKLDIEKRENNLMFVNVIESDKPNDREKNAEDVKMVQELFCGVEDIDDGEITETMRMGKPGQKPRMLRVTFKTKEIRNKILTKSGQMNTDLHVGIDDGRIFVNPDFTANQRERLKELRNEIAVRKANGERNLGIRDLKIVVKKPKWNIQGNQKPDVPGGSQGGGASGGGPGAGNV